MRIDIPDTLWGVLQQRAHAMGQPVDAVAAAAIAASLGGAAQKYHSPVWAGIGQMVDAGLTDADIATATHFTVGYVAQVRRSLRMPPNRRTRNVNVPDGVPHGSKSTYDRYGCRCKECRAANSAYQREYRRRRAAQHNQT